MVENDKPQLKLEPQRELLETPKLKKPLSYIFLTAIAIFSVATYGYFSENSLQPENMREYPDGAMLKANENAQTEKYSKVEKMQDSPVPPEKTYNDKVALVKLWDYDDEDGDIVRIQTSKFSIDVTIVNNPVNLEIPYAEGDNLNFIGVRDGGGGITASIEVMMRPVPLPPLAVGQTISLPVL